MIGQLTDPSSWRHSCGTLSDPGFSAPAVAVPRLPLIIINAHTFTVSLSRSLSLSLPVLLAHLHTLTLLARDVHHRYFLIKSCQNALCAVLTTALSCLNEAH